MYFLLAEGEDVEAFVELRFKLTLQYAPCGPDEEDCVLTMAKCCWRKQRYQQFQSVGMTSAKFDPNTRAYDEGAALQALVEALQKVKQEIEVERILRRLEPAIRNHLAERCPRGRYRSTPAWIKALLRDVQKVLLPIAFRYGNPSKELLLHRGAAVLTHEALDSELEYERKLDAEFDRALKRLFHLKAAKPQIDFSERRRFHFSILNAHAPGGDNVHEREAEIPANMRGKRKNSQGQRGDQSAG